MAATCQEGGAPILEDCGCIDHFYALLLLEHEVAAEPGATSGGPYEVDHFDTVSS